MKIGTVLGVLQSRQTAPGYEGARWVQLRAEQGITVALDPVGVQTGQTVIYAEGISAARYDMQAPADAVIIAAVSDGES